MKLGDILISEEIIDLALGRQDIISYTKVVYPEIEFTDFHTVYYKILQLFAEGKIKNLMVTIPPQHGKSTGSSEILPSFIFGQNPNKKIAIGSYSQTFARKFTRAVKRIINSEKYYYMFPDVVLSRTARSKKNVDYVNSSDYFELVDKKGFFKVVGRGGGLTGEPVDIMIMDDLYKDREEGNSPVIREKVITWYTGVVRKRLHNDSQQLIVFTRWHEGDLIGYLEENETVVTVNCWADLEKIEDPDTWVKINFEAIKETEKTEFDNRELGEPLFGKKHSIKKLEKERRLNALEFECMNQGNPTPKEGLLYSSGFKTYDTMPKMILARGNCTDTADEGDCYLASFCYNKVRIKMPDDEKERTYLFVTDIIYNQDPMELTEPQVALMLDNQNTRIAHIESNNGGKGFARQVKLKITGSCVVIWEHESGNKESRITTNATTVADRIIFPVGWEKKYPEVFKALSLYKRLFKANKFHDMPDVLTMAVEKEIIRKSGSGVKRKN